MMVKVRLAEKLPFVEERDERFPLPLRIAAYALAGAAALGAIGFFLARDQMVRHRRDLFSPHPLRRLAALGYLRSRPQVDNVMLLRDFLAWEERPLLRKRAAAILEDMEESLAEAEAERQGAHDRLGA